jgi:hypothetical protein
MSKAFRQLQLWGMAAVVVVIFGNIVAVQAQMILPLPSDLDSIPAFRLSGGAASAGSFDDFLNLISPIILH